MSELADCVVMSCRRIGRPRQDGIQPLLVTLDSSDSASYFVANAKKLRHSHDSEIRASVYISEDLTPSESKAAYEIRRRRREQQNRWQDRNETHREQPQSQPVRQASRLVYRSQPPATNCDNVPAARVPDDNQPMSVSQSDTSSKAADFVPSTAADNQPTTQPLAAVGGVGNMPAYAATLSVSGRPR
jgi:hypothetical protein